MSSITLVDFEITAIMAGNVWMVWRWTCFLVCLQTCWNHKLCFNMITPTKPALVTTLKYNLWFNQKLESEIQMVNNSIDLKLNEESLIKFWQINCLIKYRSYSYKAFKLGLKHVQCTFLLTIVIHVTEMILAV